MRVTQHYPLIQVEDVAGSAAFFAGWLGLRPVFESDWYVQLQSEADPSLNLAILDCRHETIPEGARGPTRGLILTYEVEDARAEHERALASGIPIAQDLRDEPHGQRHFIVRGPAGVLVDIVTPIPPAEGFEEGYAPDALPS